VSNYSAAGIPLEALWLDIEYMGDRFKTLTFDKGMCCGTGGRCNVSCFRQFQAGVTAGGWHIHGVPAFGVPSE
jgi:hypothetical protein